MEARALCTLEHPQPRAGIQTGTSSPNFQSLGGKLRPEKTTPTPVRGYPGKTNKQTNMDAVGQKGVEQDLLEIKTTQKNPQTQPRPVSMDWRPSHCRGQGQSGALLQLYPKPFWEKILYMAHGQGNSHTSKDMLDSRLSQR